MREYKAQYYKKSQKQPREVTWHGFTYVLNWSGSKKYKHIMRPGLCNGKFLASGEQARQILIINLMKCLG